MLGHANCMIEVDWDTCGTAYHNHIQFHLCPGSFSKVYCECAICLAVVNLLHLVALDSADVVVLVVDVIEQHDRVAPLHVHHHLVVALQIHFRRFLDLQGTGNCWLVEWLDGWLIERTLATGSVVSIMTPMSMPSWM